MCLLCIILFYIMQAPDPEGGLVLGKTSVVVCFYNEEFFALMRTVWSVFHGMPVCCAPDVSGCAVLRIIILI